MSSNLSEFCELISGRHIPVNQYNTESKGIGYLTGPSDFGPLNPTVTKWTEHPQSVARQGDILITVKGSGVGKINSLQLDEVAISRQLMAIRPKNINSRFLYLFLSSRFDHFQSLANGAAIPGISRGDVLDLNLPLHEIPEQRRIVGILDEAFAGIATAKANAEKNLQNARALFESHLNAVFTQRGDDWVDKPFGECFRLKSGDGLTSKAMKPGAYPVFGGNGIAGMHDDFNLSGDNVIIGRVGALCGNARHITEKIWLTDNAFKIVDFIYEFDGAFLTYLLNYKNLRSLARQAAQPVISNSSLKDLVLRFPGLPEQQRITVQLDALTSETQRLESIYQRKLAALDELKKSLLHQAFSGHLSGKHHG